MTSQQQQDSLVAENKELHKIQFQVMDNTTNKPLSEILYELYNKDSGELLVRGYTDKTGMTALYNSQYSPESIEIITIDLSKTLQPI
jgi:ribosomal protein S24E